MAGLFDELRPKAFAVAYRMLGSVSDAEDIVQEALLRLHRAQEAGERIESPRAYVATIVTRLAIDELRSARARREVYVGEWLPEPLLTGDAEPADHAEITDSLSFAFLVLLESLSPEQRAVFLLRDVFGYPYDDVARIVGKSEAACRQLAVRARRHIAQRKPRFEASPEQREQLAERFFAAIDEGDIDALETLLANDVALHGDGGGKVPAIARALHGRERVAHTLLTWARAATRSGGFSTRRLEVNGQPGAITFDPDGKLINVMALGIAGDRIERIDSIVNPDKLRRLGPVADLAALLKGKR